MKRPVVYQMAFLFDNTAYAVEANIAQVANFPLPGTNCASKLAVSVSANKR